jgi:hypothetical protein
MRNLILGIILTVTLASFVSPISDELSAAFKSGDSAKIAEHFSKSVDLSIPGNEGVFSKTQAELILKTFFEKHQPKDFKIVHNGDSKNDSHYSIGNLITSKGTFRTYILYRDFHKVNFILELRIEKIESDE